MSSELASFLQHSPGMTGDQIARLLTMFQSLNPKVDDISFQNLVINANQRRIRTISFTVLPPNIVSNPTRQRRTGYWKKRVPLNAGPIAYTPVHTTTGTIAFPILTGSAFDTLFGGCRGDFNGTQYISIADDPLLAMGSAACAFAIMVRYTGSGTYGLFCKRNIANTTNAGIEAWISTGTTINLRISDGTNTSLLSVTVASLNDGNRHSIIFNIPASGNMEVFVDKVSKATQARGSVGSVTNTRAFYFGARDNAGTIQDKISATVALFQWKKTEIFTTTQISEYSDNGVIDTSTSNAVSVTCIPFMGDEKPVPDAYASLIKNV